MNVLKDLLNRTDCLNLLEQKLRTDKFKLIEYSIAPISNKIDGYLAYHLRLKCLVQLLLENETKIVTFFIKKETKSTIDNELIDQCLKSIPAERKELLFYQMLSEVSLQDQDLQWAPKYYPFEKEPTLLILDDLGAVGFKIHNKQYDLPHCKVLLKTLAEMHAFSIRYEYKKSEELRRPFNFYDAYGEEMLEEALLTWNNQFGERYMKTLVTSAKKVFEYFCQSTTEREAFNLALDKQLDHIITNLLKPSKEFQNVLCHADLWPKNLMFKYDANHNPVAACLIDFQIIRYTPPVNDFIMFIYVNTSQEFRSSHLKKLLEFYYNELDKILQLNGIDLEKIYSRMDFYRSFKKYVPFGKVFGGMLGLTESVDEDVFDKMLDSKESSLEFLLVDRTRYFLPLLEQNVNGYRDKCKEIINELKKFLLEPELSLDSKD